MKLCIVYLASPRAFVEHGFNTPRIDLLKTSIVLAHSVFPTTDILVFHEDYIEEDFQRFPEVKSFIQVNFSGFEHIPRGGERNRPYGYLMMCRFFSGVLQQHPALEPYTHYMRLDDDSYFMEPFPEHIETLEYDYTFRSVFHDDKDQASLFKFTIEFLIKEGYEKNIRFVKEKLYERGILAHNKYTGFAPYNNFHISSLRMWKNPLVQRYIQAIEHSGGILRYGWMDANIHAMILFVLAFFTNITVHHEASFGYRHNQHVSILQSPYLIYKKELPFCPRIDNAES